MMTFSYPVRYSKKFPDKVVWLNSISAMDFSMPWFDESILNALRSNGYYSLSHIDDLGHYLDANLPHPLAFIFHTSRCGSTLYANCCSALSRSVVIKESECINETLCRVGEDGVITMDHLKGVIELSSGYRLKNETNIRYVLKLSSFNLLFMEYFHQLFPNTKMICMYRNPLEIVASLLVTPPVWLTYETCNLLNLNMNTPLAIKAVSAVTIYLEKMLTLAQQYPISLLNYSNFIKHPLETIQDQMNISLNSDEREAILRIFQFYSKNTKNTRFSSDAESKQAMAKRCIDESDQQSLLLLYEKLELLRTLGVRQ